MATRSLCCSWGKTFRTTGPSSVTSLKKLKEGLWSETFYLTNNGGFVLPRGRDKFLDRQRERERERERKREEKEGRGRGREGRKQGSHNKNACQLPWREMPVISRQISLRHDRTSFDKKIQKKQMAQPTHGFLHLNLKSLVRQAHERSCKLMSFRLGFF